MFCYQCNGCGKCEMGRAFNHEELNGACPVCKHVSPLGAETCEACGAPLPMPPGSHEPLVAPGYIGSSAGTVV